MDRNELNAYAGREQASVKHFLLESYLARVIMITGRAKYSRIAYVDAFAGPWKSTLIDMSDTSFAKAIEVMERCRLTLSHRFHAAVGFRALFVERDTERYARLKAYADAHSASPIEITALNEDFARSAESVAQWIHSDEMALVLIDPTGWKEVVAPQTLAPLLRKPNVELLINVMWNFVSLATGHPNQLENLRRVFGEGLDGLLADEASGQVKAERFMRAYLAELKRTAGDEKAQSRLRTGWFPVEFPWADRIFYYLVYATHHEKGMITFLEVSDETEHHQQAAKFSLVQQRREVQTGVADLFGDELGSGERRGRSPEWSVRDRWLQLLPTAGSLLRVDEATIVRMAEDCGCTLSQLQSSLRWLIDEGVLVNLDAKRPRPRNTVNYRSSERIKRLK